MKKSNLFLIFSIAILLILGEKYFLQENDSTTASQFVSSNLSDDKYSVSESEESISQKEYNKQQETEEEEKKLIEDTISGLDLYSYYYDNLSSEMQTVYGEIYYAIVNYQSVDVSTLDKEKIDDAFKAVMADHPEIFNVSGYQMVSQSMGDEVVNISVNATYTYDADETEELNAKVEEAAGEILKNISSDWTDYNKIKYIYDYIIQNTQYESDQDDQNIISVLLHGKSVCNGYSKTMQYLLNKMDVPCTIVTGDTQRGKHAWNLVEADGHYYYLDVTWGDTDFDNSASAGSGDSKVMDINYSYFLVDYNTISLKHTADEIVPLPQCTSNMDNYFVHEDLYLSVLDESYLQTMFNRAYAESADHIQFRCANEIVYKDTYSYLIDEQGIFDYMQQNDTVSYYYDDDLYIFYFWFD